MNRAITGSNPFSGDYGAIELAFYERRISAERALLSHLYAAGGDIRHLIELARTQGVSDSAWLDDLGEHTLLWRLACKSSDTGSAREAAQQAARDGKIFVIDLDDLFRRVFVSEAFTVLCSILLMRELAAEREARLIRARYVSLMTGTVKAKVPTTTNLIASAA